MFMSTLWLSRKELLLYLIKYIYQKKQTRKKVVDLSVFGHVFFYCTYFDM